MRVCLILRADLYRPWPILRAMREVDLLKSQGKDVTVVSWIKDQDSKLPAREVLDSVEVRRIFLSPPRASLLRFPAFLKVNRLLAKEALDSNPDALLVHDLEVLKAGVLVKKKLGVPLLYHAHEDWPEMVSERSKLEAAVFSFLERRYCRNVDHVYVPSDGIGRKYIDWRLKVTVQYASKSLADLPRLTSVRRQELRGRYGLGDQDFVVGLAGSLGRSEAFRSILSSLKDLPQEVKLLVVGGLDQKVSAAIELVASEGLSERVKFTGTLEPTPYMEHVGILDAGLALFIGTTLNVTEVVPIKLFDYMAMGVPVVASDFPAMKRIVMECKCGYAVNAKDPSSIASAIRRLHQDQTIRGTFSQNAIRAFETTYCWERQLGLLKDSSKIFA